MLELQHRILELEERNSLELDHNNSQPTASPRDRISFFEDMRQQGAHLTSDGVGGPWVIGHIRHPPLKGRAMRDVGVQVHLSLPSSSALQSQGHAQVQTDALETSDRSSSPLPVLPPNKDADVGKPERLLLINFLANYCSVRFNFVERA